MSLQTTRIAAAVAVCVLATSVYAAEPQSKTPAKTSGKVSVNGVMIPPNRVDMIVKARAQQGQPETPDVRNAVRENLIMQEVVAQAAQRKGLDKNPEVVAQMDLARQSVLVQAYYNDYTKANP